MLTARRRIVTQFSPAVLAPALWIEARRTDSMYTSNAGTGGVTDTATVGYVRDLSPNGFDLTSAADDTTRPTWNVNGGLPYLNFDGSNDYIRRTSSLGMYAAGTCSVFAAMRGNPGTTKYFLNEARGTTSANPIYTLLASTGTASTEAAFLRNDANTVLINTLPLATGCYDNTDRVIGTVDDGAVLSVYKDGTKTVSQAYTRSGTLTIDIFNLGALRQNSSTSIWFAARLYALVIVNRALSEGDAKLLTRYLGARAGLAF